MQTPVAAWGDTVNVAPAGLTTGEADRIQVSEWTAEPTGDSCRLEYYAARWS